MWQLSPLSSDTRRINSRISGEISTTQHLSGSEVLRVGATYSARSETGPDIPSQWRVPAGTHTPRCVGTTHEPSRVVTVTTPCDAKVSWCHGCRCGSTMAPCAYSVGTPARIWYWRGSKKR